MSADMNAPLNWLAPWHSSETVYGARIDLLFIGLLISSLLVSILLFYLMLRFAFRYRAANDVDRDHRVKKSWYWEVSWTTLTFVAFLGMFVWSAKLFLNLSDTPADALPVYVIAKQWMWKVQHVGGQREINELHIPVGRDVRLIMTSQDVIHSFFMPDFRIKHDVVPGRYQDLWFKPEKAGVFHLFCSEYCGTDHARMVGRIVVMEPSQFQTWLTQQDVGGTLAAKGEQLFRQFGCSGCHGNSSTVRAPPLEGLYGKPVPLQDGSIAVADERYIRDSILQPRSQITAGYAPVMPTFEGKISEDDLISIVAYIKSLGDQTRQR
jgi:cytochrome c oxidase subunit 2